MSEQLTNRMNELADAVRGRDVRPQVVFCGFDLWIDCMSSEHAGPIEFVKGGKRATGEEGDDTLKVPMMGLGGKIVISFDPTLPADEFVLKP